MIRKALVSLAAMAALSPAAHAASGWGLLNMTQGVTAISREIYKLHMLIFYVCVIIGVIVIFFTLELPKGGIQLNWWGNSVWQNTVDANLTPLKTVAPGEIFGPSSWS